jgi:single-strand selective monofunctional uracil DNA glycosylase
MRNMDTPEQVLTEARKLQAALAQLRFRKPVAHVYNPLDYAWAPYEAYVRAYGAGPKRVVFLGMNPGPFGMVQTGVPFGEVAAVRDWLKISGRVQRPGNEHPRRPVQGFECPRSEVSGRRLWGLFAGQFGTPEAFFREHFVLNYCPLAFMENTGRNRTPDKLTPKERAALFNACDTFLKSALAILRPQWVIGVGDFAMGRAQEVVGQAPPRVGRILHPSPANPAANRDWPGKVTAQLIGLGVWTAA